MKKFSKLIIESKKDHLTNHPLINPVDWDEVFVPLIEHIDGNLKSKVPSPGVGIFESGTKDALNNLIKSITKDYIEYYKNVIDDGSQESFFNAYDISVEWNGLMDCVLPLSDRTDEVEEFPVWDEGLFYMRFSDLKFKTLKEFEEDILDISNKLKMFNINYCIIIIPKIPGLKPSAFHDLMAGRPHSGYSIYDSTGEKEIVKGIRDILELPGEDMSQWIKGLDKVEIFIYNQNTVQSKV